ncbi:MAG: hypothetical protein JWP59_680 [Massilia sp.]|nr:hypothetical protein [Massilia sp.]
MTAVFPAPQAVKLQGVLGDALAANLAGRLSHFIVDGNSEPIALFGQSHKCCNEEGDWYGEHAGKWLYAAARAANRSGDAVLRAHLLEVADFLVGQQDADGYLGTYAPSRRFMHQRGRGPRTWDGAPRQRTWDIWTHSYLILGMLEVNRYFPDPRYLQCATRIGQLCLDALTVGGIDITDLGNHHGMSATVLLDPAVELFFATGAQRFLTLAQTVLAQADARPELNLLGQSLAGVDAAEIATGKAYQLCWNMVGLAKLHRATGNPDYLQAVINVWTSIRDYHLSLGGGPWGGIAHRSREVFNAKGAFDPYGYIETCSTFSWIQLNRELLAITGEAVYAEEIERAAYNDLLAAQAPNGEDWCYYIYPNGKRVYTTYWRCCKSSGAMALEELAPAAYSVDQGRIAVNLYGPGTAELDGMRITQLTNYPFDGDIRLVLALSTPTTRTLSLRIPAWAEGARVSINGVCQQAPAAGAYLDIEREWRDADMISLLLPMAPRLHRQVSQNTQESLAPDGSPVAQQVMRYDYVAVTRGPLVYATGLIDGFKREETLKLPAGDALEMAPAPEGGLGPAIRMKLGYRPDLLFQPYFEAGGRVDGSWRLTWMQVAE